MFRSADELLDTPDPAWPLIQKLIDAGGTSAQLLMGEGARGRREIESLQVTARSCLGAMANHVGGLLVDHGWLRILGCGHEHCTWSITSATRCAGFTPGAGPPKGVVVAVDVLGGLFAINGGFLDHVPAGRVAYFGPDTLRWEEVAGGHTAWLEGILDAERRRAYYANLRWSGWERETQALPPNTGLHIYPPLWTRESRPLEATHRAGASLEELVALTLGTPRFLQG